MMSQIVLHFHCLIKCGFHLNIQYSYICCYAEEVGWLTHISTVYCTILHWPIVLYVMYGSIANAKNLANQWIANWQFPNSMCRAQLQSCFFVIQMLTREETLKFKDLPRALIFVCLYLHDKQDGDQLWNSPVSQSINSCTSQYIKLMALVQVVAPKIPSLLWPQLAALCRKPRHQVQNWHSVNRVGRIQAWKIERNAGSDECTECGPCRVNRIQAL